MADEPTRRARLLGCILGGAVGDALGNDIEFLSTETIRRRWGPAGITGNLLGVALGLDAVPAAWLDDLLERALVETVATDFVDHFWGDGPNDRADIDRYPGSRPFGVPSGDVRRIRSW